MNGYLLLIHITLHSMSITHTDMPEIFISKIIFWLLEYCIFDVRFSTINVVSQYSIKNVITLISFTVREKLTLIQEKKRRMREGSIDGTFIILNP